MRKLGIFAVALALVAATDDIRMQDADGARAAVDQLFLGMRMADERLVREVLASDVRFAVLGPEGQIASQSLDGFVRAIGASAGAWNEQIYDVEVRVDDAMASVWAPYTFYLSGTISHCGINSIELLRDAAGWKITQVSDTRRTEGCPDPMAGR
jgi:hypothetical protein